MKDEITKTSDETLVVKAQSGDTDCTNVLLERYKPVVRARARSFFLVGGETEDLIQEGMVGLYEAITVYNGKSSFKNFAYLCISRRIIDAVKIAARGKNNPLNDAENLGEIDLEGGYNAEEELIRIEDRSEFYKKISKALSVYEFKIFIMYVDGMSYSEISEATGKDFKSIDNALQRSKKKLIKILT